MFVRVCRVIHSSYVTKYARELLRVSSRYSTGDLFNSGEPNQFLIIIIQFLFVAKQIVNWWTSFIGIFSCITSLEKTVTNGPIVFCSHRTTSSLQRRSDRTIIFREICPSDRTRVLSRDSFIANAGCNILIGFCRLPQSEQYDKGTRWCRNGTSLSPTPEITWG